MPNIQECWSALLNPQNFQTLNFDPNAPSTVAALEDLEAFLTAHSLDKSLSERLTFASLEALDAGLTDRYLGGRQLSAEEYTLLRPLLMQTHMAETLKLACAKCKDYSDCKR